MIFSISYTKKRCLNLVYFWSSRVLPDHWLVTSPLEFDHLLCLHFDLPFIPTSPFISTLISSLMLVIFSCRYFSSTTSKADSSQRSIPSSYLIWCSIFNYSIVTFYLSIILSLSISILGEWEICFSNSSTLQIFLL